MLQGSIVALITPMTDEGRIDFAGLRRLVEYHIDSGTHAIVAMGTTGESSTLCNDEHIEVVRQIVSFAAGRMPVIAGTGSNDTAHAVRLNQAVADSGAVAVLSVTPYYNKPTQEGLFQHFTYLAERSSLPVILYNVPGRTGCDLLPVTVARLATHPNIIGIKEATGNLERLAQLKALCPADFAFYSGDDATSREFMLQGGQGTISVTANAMPAQMAAMSELAITGQQKAAENADRPLQALHEALFVESNPIPVKWACHALGLIDSDAVRLPLVRLSVDAVPKVRKALELAGATFK